MPEEKMVEDILQRLPKRLQWTISIIDQKKCKLLEIYEYKTSDDYSLREIFWEKVEKLRLLIEKNIQDCYYSGDCTKGLNFFMCAVANVMELREIMDEILTNSLDGIVCTNLRVVFKNGNKEYLSAVERVIDESGSMNLIKTAKYLKSIKGKKSKKSPTKSPPTSLPAITRGSQVQLPALVCSDGDLRRCRETCLRDEEEESLKPKKKPKRNRYALVKLPAL